MTYLYETQAVDHWRTYVVQQQRYRQALARQPRRRALLGLEMDIKISLPDVGFTLPLGGKQLGAEFGLKFSSSAQLYFSLLKSSFSVDVLGQAYGSLYVGTCQCLRLRILCLNAYNL